ncbi:MAG: pyridoxamine 5'-phosphate oxidase family protein [Candidatus Eremiobacteraeota bacterium]|nr:pyridoxamine 5'-phosphate oxidase family protein [Candidatus Eremiobacteraeota bacterium]MBV8223032.1 pyridoxamine 5'-phosphate oxidase family protein [Candidatus Eremiobacteraeota bacterium]
MLGRLNEQEIEEVLRAELLGRIGCHAQGRTYVVPVTYAYDNGAVYGQSAEGRKLQMMRANPNVCFEVDQVEDLATWRSVIAWGRFEELRGADADRGLALLMARLLPMTITSETSHPPKSLTHQHRAQEQGLAAVVYRIVLTETSGRFERR